MDNDGEIKLGVTIDPAGANSGADEAVEAVKKVGGAAKSAATGLEKAAESTHNLQGEQLGSLRTAHHFVEALLGIARGGPQAAAGVAMLTRIITEMGEASIGVGAPLLLVFSTLAAVAIPAVTKALGETGEKGKESTDGIKDSTDAYVGSLNDVLRAQEQIEAALKRELSLSQEQQKLTADKIKLDEQAAGNHARQDYLLKLPGAKTDEERKRLKDQLDAQLEDIRNESAVATAQLNLKNKQEDLAAAQNQVASLRKQHDDNEKRRSDLASAADQDALFMANNRLSFDEKGKLVQKLPGKDGKEVDAVAHANEVLDQLRAAMEVDQRGAAGAAEAGRFASPEKRNEMILLAQIQAEKSHAAYVKQQQYVNDLDPGTVGKASKENAAESGPLLEKMVKQADEIETLKGQIAKLVDGKDEKGNVVPGEITLAREGLTNAQTTSSLVPQTRKAEQKVQDAKEAREKARKDRDDLLKAQQEEIEGKMAANPNAPQAQKDIYTSELAKLQVKGLQNEMADNLADNKLTPALRQFITAEIHKVQEEAKGKIASGDAQAAAKVESAEEKATRDKIQQAAGKIEATGSKPMIEAMHSVLAAFRGRSDEAAQLQELTQLTNVLAGNFMQYQRQTDSELSRLGRALESNKNNHRN